VARENGKGGKASVQGAKANYQNEWLWNGESGKSFTEKKFRREGREEWKRKQLYWGLRGDKTLISAGDKQ